MPIKRSDIEKGDVFGGLSESAKKAKVEVNELKTLMSAIKTLAKGIKTSLSSIKPINSKAIREHNALTKNANTLTNESIRINKNLEQLKQAKIRTQQTELRLAEQQKRAQEKETKAAKKAAIETQKQTNAYLIQGKRIRELTAQYRHLFITEGKETSQTRKLKAEILSLNKIRNKANENLGQHQNKVGQYGRAISKLRGGLAQLGLAFGVFRLLRGAGSVIVDLDTAVTDLGAISRKTTDQLKPLTDQALELGATTQFTATEISNLQIELAKLGFTTEEIMSSTGPISRFATATGSEIPEAAQLAGSALRAFGLDASEMERVVSVMGVATTKTGLDFTFLQTAMSTIAPVANAFGFSIEDTTALLGQLANSGFDASSAATATRNILLNLADANGALAKSLGHPVTNADELAEALSELESKGVDLATALELTDKRSVAAFETFLKGADSLVPLRDSITGVSSELQEMSDKRLDSVAGQADLLKSAWEGLILGWSKGNGVGEKVKDTLSFLAKNLKTIINLVILGAKWFLAYRIQVALLGKEFAKLSFGRVVSMFRIMLRNIPKLVKGFKLSTLSVKSFGKAIGRIPFVQIISALVTLGPMLLEFVSDLFSGAEATTRLQDATAKATNEIVKEKAGMESLFQQLKRTNVGTQARADLIDKINANYGTTLENLSDETEFARQLERVYDDLNAQLEKKIKLQVFEEELVKIIGEELRLRKAIEQAVTGQTITDEELRKARDVGGTQFLLDVLKKTIDEKKGVFDAINDLSGLDGGIKKTTPEKPGSKRPTEVVEDDDTGVKALTKAQKLTAFKKLQATELAEFENELLRNNDLDTESRAILLAQKEIELARETGRKIIELDFEDKGVLIKHENDYLKKVENLEDQKLAYYKKTGEEIKDNSLETLQEQINAEEALRKKAEVAEAKALKDRAKFREDVISSSTDKVLELADERISKINQEIAASDRQSALLKQRAAAGNIAAQESLAAQNQIKAEAEAQKAKIERQKQQVELVSAFVTAYSNALGEGKSAPEALQEAALGTGGVQAFISSIPSFMDGVENTGAQGYGVDGKGGFNAILHPYEKVLNRADTAKIGPDYSNGEIANVMYKHRNGDLVEMSQQPYQSVIDLSNLEAKMSDVVTAIKSMPENKTDIGTITSTYMKINESRTVGNKTTSNRFKVG